MRKVNKVIMATVSILLSLVIASGSILSGVLARYTYSKGLKSQGAGFNKWGITVDAGSDVAAEYKNSDNTVMIKSNSHNVIAPGTNGCLAWFKVQSSGTEVKFKLDFECTNFEIGTGYSSSSKYVRKADGTPIDYFPIIFLVVAYDIGSDGKIKQVSTVKNVDNKTMNFTVGHKKDENNGVVIFSKANQIYSFNTFANVEKWLNGEGDYGVEYKAGLSKVFDQKYETFTNGVISSFTRVYTIQWCWPYDAETSHPRNQYKKGTYQTREYDTQIGEAMKNNIGDFAITLDMSLTVEQIQ
jgi:hypothetical protein